MSEMFITVAQTFISILNNFEQQWNYNHLKSKNDVSIKEKRKAKRRIVYGTFKKIGIWHIYIRHLSFNKFFYSLNVFPKNVTKYFIYYCIFQIYHAAYFCGHIIVQYHDYSDLKQKTYAIPDQPGVKSYGNIWSSHRYFSFSLVSLEVVIAANMINWTSYKMISKVGY